MELFYLISVFLLLGSFIKRKFQNLYIYISFVLLFILSAFRGVTVGTDTSGYKLLFSRLEEGYPIRQEIGWQYLNKLIINLGGSFEDLLIVSSLFVLVPIFYTVKKYSPNPMLSLFIYFSLYLYLQSFNITRQAIAVSIVFSAIPFLINNRFWFFSFFIVLASTFHITALLCLPLIFINKIPDKKLLYIILISGALIIGVFATEIIFLKSAELFGYDQYIDKTETGVQTGIFLLALNAMAILILLTEKNRGLLFKLFIFYIIFANLTARIPYGHRIISYFSIIQILYLPYFLKESKKQFKPLVLSLIVVYSYLVFYRNAGSGDIVPYINTLFQSL